MPDILRYALQAAVYVGIAAAIGLFAAWPPIDPFPADKAQLKLSLAHGGQRKEECRRRTAEELEALAPNMRKELVCERERVPVWIEVLVDDQVLFRGSAPPTGLSGDGPSRIHARFQLEPGQRRLQLRLRDSGRTEGYDYELDEMIELRPRQNLAVDFRPETGGFILM
jgi:hypothetical protein